jgi:hypothetical protein
VATATHDRERWLLATLRCWCGAPIRVAGDPAAGVVIRRHGDDPLTARVLAAEPDVLRAPAIRA